MHWCTVKASCVKSRSISSTEHGPTLVYFDFPVRADVARLLFTLGKVEFEVSRVKMEAHLRLLLLAQTAACRPVNCCRGLSAA